jgi:hypothetical protein
MLLWALSIATIQSNQDIALPYSYIATRSSFSHTSRLLQLWRLRDSICSKQNCIRKRKGTAIEGRPDQGCSCTFFGEKYLGMMKGEIRSFDLSPGNQLNTKSKWYEDSKYTIFYSEMLTWFLCLFVISLRGTESCIGRSLFNTQKRKNVCNK